jgi:hypothetical protein
MCCYERPIFAGSASLTMDEQAEMATERAEKIIELEELSKGVHTWDLEVTEFAPLVVDMLIRMMVVRDHNVESRRSLPTRESVACLAGLKTLRSQMTGLVEPISLSAVGYLEAVACLFLSWSNLCLQLCGKQLIACFSHTLAALGSLQTDMDALYLCTWLAKPGTGHTLSSYALVNVYGKSYIGLGEQKAIVSTLALFKPNVLAFAEELRLNADPMVQVRLLSSDYMSYERCFNVGVGRVLQIGAVHCLRAEGECC